MKKGILIFALAAACIPALGQTLEECQRAAEQNYPLIRQYGLIEKTTQLTLANIQKGWLPQVSATAQATYQSDVASWPEGMTSMMKGMGIDMKGLKKDQYRVGVDISQTVYDGGAISSQKQIAQEQEQVQLAQTEVSLYQVKKRVNEMYFSLLMLEEQMQLNRDLQELLFGNERKLESMVKRGTAAESDWLNVKAERLNVMQQATTLESTQQMLKEMLSTFCGLEVKDVQKPDGTSLLASTEGQRPELKLFDAQLRLAEAQEKSLNAALKPRFGLFAQGYYGYPGLNMFEDMMRHQWSWNGIIGARLTWNIGALYTRKNDKAKLKQQRLLTESNREVFLFNNRLEQIQQNQEIARYRKLMTDDEEIIQLRANVRKAAESKLAHGIIDVNDLVREINQENAARVQQKMHELEMLKQIYDNAYTKGQKVE
ncbi:MAG: TolC family protein [Bacteroidaceae bacterium]|nr:TolC family protein [Bacteroidaceae bacterium]